MQMGPVLTTESLRKVVYLRHLKINSINIPPPEALPSDEQPISYSVIGDDAICRSLTATSLSCYFGVMSELFPFFLDFDIFIIDFDSDSSSEVDILKIS